MIEVGDKVSGSATMLYKFPDGNVSLGYGTVVRLYEGKVFHRERLPRDFSFKDVGWIPDPWAEVEVKGKLYQARVTWLTKEK